MEEIISILTAAKNKARLLENLVEDIFKDLGYSNVRRQKSGSQYGYDVIAYKGNECWKVECKNLNKEATLKDIAPKLAWHFSGDNIDRFVIVSINGISNDLRYLLEQRSFSFPIELWCEEFLVKLIYNSPNALKRLNLKKPNCSDIENAKAIIFPAHELEFKVVYSRRLPFSHDYFKLDEELIKAYTEEDFRLTATISNKTNRTFIVSEIKVKTLKFENTNGFRVLRQLKQKGNIEPLKLTFNPSQYPEGEIELNGGKLLEVKNNTNEYLEFKLSNKCQPGYFELIFEIHCVDGDKTFSLYSPIFQLHKKSFKNDLVRLYVVGKYYDTPIDNILELDNKTWLNIKQEYPNSLKYLGPTILDIGRNTQNYQTWTINLLKGKKNKRNGASHLDIKPTSKSKLLINLDIPIEEPIYRQEDAIREVLK